MFCFCRLRDQTRGRASGGPTSSYKYPGILNIIRNSEASKDIESKSQSSHLEMRLVLPMIINISYLGFLSIKPF